MWLSQPPNSHFLNILMSQRLEPDYVEVEHLGTPRIIGKAFHFIRRIKVDL